MTELKNRVELLSNRPPATADDAAANAEQEAGDSDVSKAAVAALNASDAQYVERELLLLQETIMTLKVRLYDVGAVTSFRSHCIGWCTVAGPAGGAGSTDGEDACSGAHA